MYSKKDFKNKKENIVIYKKNIFGLRQTPLWEKMD